MVTTVCPAIRVRVFRVTKMLEALTGPGSFSWWKATAAPDARHPLEELLFRIFQLAANQDWLWKQSLGSLYN